MFQADESFCRFCLEHDCMTRSISIGVSSGRRTHGVTSYRAGRGMILEGLDRR